MITVDAALRNFGKFLSQSWPNVQALGWQSRLHGENWTGHIDPYALDDWMQANWELLVERIVCEPGEYLAFYGDGGDINGESNRVWKPEAEPTHEIYCTARAGVALNDKLTGKTVTAADLVDFTFVSFDGKQFALAPPFSHLLFEPEGSFIVLSIDDVEFKKRALP